MTRPSSSSPPGTPTTGSASTTSTPLVTLSVFTENHVGLLSRVTSAFTRRSVNIESLSVAASELPGVHRFTIVVAAPRTRVEQIALQLDKQVDVIKAFVHDDDEVVVRELVLVKLDASARRVPGLEALLRAHDARVLEADARSLMLEKLGTPDEATALVAALQPYGVLEACRSGHVALTRPMRRLVDFLVDVDGPADATPPPVSTATSTSPRATAHPAA
jgi:acetolactate synthase-1/3 small subunit